MALFGSLMRDLDSDPFFGLARALEPGGLRQMEAMMEGMLGPMLGAFPGFAGARRSASLGAFPALDDLFSATGAQQQPPAQCHSFSSSSVVTMTTDEHGQPQVYQASQCTRTAPGGVKETRRSLQDSRTGLQELTIGHHLDDRAHIVGRKRNRRTGDEDHSVHYVNLDEEEAEGFSQEWQQRAQCLAPRPRSMYAALPAALPAVPALLPPATGSASSQQWRCWPCAKKPQQSRSFLQRVASGGSLYSQPQQQRPKRRAKQRPRHETSM
ncbi:myeloid leukemia factor 2-like isoform X4 [Haemaphysalis longicornis]